MNKIETIQSTQFLQQAIANLLNQAGTAHHQYEQTVLNGVYDQEWANWYGDYLIANGLNDLLNQSVTVAHISQFLTRSYAIYNQESSSERWATYTAKAILQELKV